MTYLQLVNAVLRRLRRQEVASVSASSYSTLVGDLVNAAKREVEDSWNWLELMTETSISVVSGTDTYTLTGYGGRYQIHQVHDITRQGRVRPIKQKDFRYYKDFPGTTTGPPNGWRISGYSSGDPQLQVWPEPASDYTLTVYAKVAQADLTADATELTVPDWPVVLGAYARAINERGEDGGMNAQEASADARIALGDAIAQDSANRAHNYEADWVVV